MFIDDENQLNEENTCSNNPFEQKDEQTDEVQEQQDVEVKEETPCECEKLKEELDDLNNKYLRLAADFDNFRKRQAQERESLLKYGAADTLTKILVVLDSFERAKKSLDELDDIQGVREGYEVVFKQLIDVLKKVGLEEIEAVGKEFDPNLHEAIARVPSEEHPDNIVVAQMQTGYKLGDRVLRPALVSVSHNEEA